mmetsp:Transcript_35217/g.113227  ORF Transcript_35217/g.113227 Transcript_35217/m.113227 type:complete len:235 (-) Transcript_35217:206-910(-)
MLPATRPRLPARWFIGWRRRAETVPVPTRWRCGWRVGQRSPSSARTACRLSRRSARWWWCSPLSPLRARYRTPCSTSSSALPSSCPPPRRAPCPPGAPRLRPSFRVGSCCNCGCGWGGGGAPSSPSTPQTTPAPLPAGSLSWRRAARSTTLTAGPPRSTSSGKAPAPSGPCSACASRRRCGSSTRRDCRSATACGGLAAWPRLAIRARAALRLVRVRAMASLAWRRSRALQRRA